MTASLLVGPERLAAGPLEVTGDDHAYLFLARRLAVGDAVRIFDGCGRQAEATVAAVRADRATLEVGAPMAVPRTGPTITVIQAVIKGERMDWCLEKLVEIGVDRIVPCVTSRSVVRLDDARRARRVERYQAIAREAARQCQRADIPTVEPIMPLADALRSATAEVRLVADPRVYDRPLLSAGARTAATIELIIGPEGGLSAQELDEAAAAGFVPVSLGPHVLRAETAGLAAVAVLRATRDRSG